MSAGQSILVRSLDGDFQWLARLTAAAWFAELRYHRSAGSLTDFAMRLFPIAFDSIETGDAIGILSLIPLEISGLGTYGVYIDAQGGIDLTAEDENDTPEEIAANPASHTGHWLAPVLKRPRSGVGAEAPAGEARMEIPA